MIRSFADKELERVFNRTRSRSPQHLQKRLRNRLELLDGAETVEDLAAIPGGYLEPLKGEREGQYSLRVSGNWRLCFVWREGHVYDLELVDYH
jgi:proteic killer suppression protein